MPVSWSSLALSVAAAAERGRPAAEVDGVEKAGAVGSVLFVPVALPPEGDRLLALNPRGSRLAVSHAGADHVWVFETKSGKPVARLTGFQHVSGVLFLSAEVLLVAAFGGCFRCSLHPGGHALLSPEGWQSRLTLSPDGRVLAIGVDFGLAWFDLVKKQETYRFGACLLSVHKGYYAGFSPGRRYLAADLHVPGRAGGLVVVWDA